MMPTSRYAVQCAGETVHVRDGIDAPGPWAGPAVRVGSVIVPVPLVGGVPVAVVDIVLVVAVRDGGVAAAFAVLVGMALVDDMGGGSHSSQCSACRRCRCPSCA